MTSHPNEDALLKAPTGVHGPRDSPLAPLEVYQLHWSHYCNKVHMALDFKGLPWKPVNVNPFTKEQMIKPEHKGVRKLTPLVWDPNTRRAISDSSQILRYLDEAYPTHPLLFPPAAKDAVLRWCVDVDNHVGNPARRLAYARVCIECPGVLGKLFVQPWFPWAGLPVLRTLSSALVAMVLIQRFRMQHNVEEGVFEQAEAFLRRALAHLQLTEDNYTRKFLVGDGITAAEITFIALAKPLKFVPRIYENAEFALLFRWLDHHAVAMGQSPHHVLHELVQHVRKVHPLPTPPPGHTLPTAPPKAQPRLNVAYKKRGGGSGAVAENDHHHVKYGLALLWYYPWCYLWKLPQQLYQFPPTSSKL